MSQLTTQRVLARLRAEQPELLKDVTDKQLKDYDLDKIDPDMAPSEMKRLAEAIARKRVEGPGLSQEESQALLKRIGH